MSTARFCVNLTRSNIAPLPSTGKGAWVEGKRWFSPSTPSSNVKISSCRRLFFSRKKRGGQAGFTLLEILFVMFIVGLMTALVAPRIGVNLDHFEAVSQRKWLEDQITQLPRRTRYVGKSLELPKDLDRPDLGDGAPPLELPAGWQLIATPPLRISPSGACSATTLELRSEKDPGASQRYQLTELDCELRALPD